MDSQQLLILFLGIVLFVIGVVELILGKTIGPWWSVGNKKEASWPKDAIIKRKENPKSYWFWVLFILLIGLIVIIVGYFRLWS